MTTLSRLALALTVLLIGCGQQSPLTPQPGFVGEAPAPLPSPKVRAFVPPQIDLVVISWTVDSSLEALEVSGFLVESAAREGGPWNALGFTTNNNMVHDLDVGERGCYRVTAVTSSPSLPSQPVCVVMQ